MQTDLGPIVQAFLTLHPMPYPYLVSSWYAKCQDWCVQEYGIRPTRRQLASQLKALGYHRILDRGYITWIKDA